MSDAIFIAAMQKRAQLLDERRREDAEKHLELDRIAREMQIAIASAVAGDVFGEPFLRFDISSSDACSSKNFIVDFVVQDDLHPRPRLTFNGSIRWVRVVDGGAGGGHFEDHSTLRLAEPYTAVEVPAKLSREGKYDLDAAALVSAIATALASL